MRKRIPISVEEALQKVLYHTETSGNESVPLATSDGRILAEKVVADHDVPPFDRSAYDGYAVRASDTLRMNAADGPPRLEVIETIPAGCVPQKKVQAGQAARIMTGALLPDGADAVLMQEDAEIVEKTPVLRIDAQRAVQSGENVSRRGEDTKKGEVLINSGTTVTPGVKAVLATFGYDRVRVARRPVVGIFATGSELIEVEESLSPGKIRNSNAHAVAGQVRAAGAVPRYFGCLADDEVAGEQAMRAALEEVDILLTTGGVSVGDFDFIPRVYDRLGAEVLFNKVAMRPGSVTTAARWQQKWLFGLSGNPAACFVGFELFVRPALRKMMGARQIELKRGFARLAQPFSKKDAFRRFVRAKLEPDPEGGWLVSPVGLDRSSIVTSLAQADVLIVFNENEYDFPRGNPVHILFLPSGVA